MATYRICGLWIRSDFDLPAFPPGSAFPDAVISLGSVSVPQAAAKSGRHSWHDLDAGYLFHQSFGAIRIAQGTEIVVDATAPDDTLLPWITGPALAILLHQRGCLVLHGSAVRWNGRACAFLGDSGAGKSTVAYALCRAGFGLLSDDHAVIDWRAGEPILLPAGPRLRLKPDALIAAGLDPESVPRLWPYQDKRGLDWSDQFAADPSPLAALYELHDGDSLGCAALDPQERFRILMRHSFLAPLLRMSGTETPHFERCARLAAMVPIARLTRPRTHDSLDQVADLLRDNLQSTHV